MRTGGLIRVNGAGKADQKEETGHDLRQAGVKTLSARFTAICSD